MTSLFIKRELLPVLCECCVLLFLKRELPFEQIRTSSNFITGILKILLQPISSKRAVSLQFNASSSLSLRLIPPKNHVFFSSQIRHGNHQSSGCRTQDTDANKHLKSERSTTESDLEGLPFFIISNSKGCQPCRF